MGNNFATSAVEMEKTTEIGNPNAGERFNVQSKAGPVKWIKACWDGEVIKGLAIKFHGDETQYNIGDWNNGGERFRQSELELSREDTLINFQMSTSRFGYGSVRGLSVETRLHQAARQGAWAPGNVTDAYSMLNVSGRVWMGVFGCRNSDQFINSLGLWVTPQYSSAVVKKGGDSAIYS